MSNDGKREYKIIVQCFHYLTDFKFEVYGSNKNYFNSLDSETQFLTVRIEFENLLKISPKKFVKIYEQFDKFKSQNWGLMASRYGVMDDDVRVEYALACAGEPVDENKFLKFPKFCVLYAKNILKKRFFAAEEVIASDPIASYLYAEHVIDGVLPEEMHSRLLMGSFVDCSSYALKKYLALVG